MPICWNLQIRWVVERLALAPVFCWFSRFDPILEDRLNFWWVWSLQEALVEGGTQSNGIKWNHTFLQFGICVFNGPFLKKTSPTVQLRHRKTWGESNWPHVGVGSVYGCLVGLRRTSLWTQVASQLLRGWLSKLCGSLEVMFWANLCICCFFCYFYISSVISISCFLHVFVFVDSFQKERDVALPAQMKTF